MPKLVNFSEKLLINISKSQKSWLRRQAYKRKSSVSRLIRELIDKEAGK